MRRRWWPWLLPALFAPLALTALPTSTTARLQGLDAYVRGTMQDWQVPGLALAIVKDGKTALDGRTGEVPDLLRNDFLP